MISPSRKVSFSGSHHESQIYSEDSVHIFRDNGAKNENPSSKATSQTSTDENTQQPAGLMYDDHDKIRLQPNTVYVFIGRPEGIASVLSPYMRDCGGGTFIFLLREQNTSEEGMRVLDKLRIAGANVQVYADSLFSASRLSTVLSLWNNDKWRIGGIVHDRTFDEDGEIDNIITHVMEVKVLHEVTATMQLDFFVAISALAAGRQGSTVVDVIAQHRSSHGLPFVAIHLEYHEDQERASHILASYPESLIIALFKSAINHPIRTSETCQVIVPGKRSSLLPLLSESNESSDSNNSAASDRSVLTDSTPPTQLEQHNHAFFTKPKGNNSERNGPQSNLQSTASITKEADTLCAAILSKMARLLGTNEEDIDFDKSSGILGVDSLIAATYSNWLEDKIKASVDTFEVLEAKSLRALAWDVVGRSELINTGKTGGPRSGE